MGALHLDAQVRIGRTSINCAGGSHLSNGILISQTAGQSSNVSVSDAPDVMIRQGFQQPNWIRAEQLESDFSVSLYPNPNSGTFTVGLNGFSGDAVKVYRVLDTQGALVSEANPETDITFPVSLPDVTTGIYFLHLESKAGKKAIVKISVM